ncbi:MAG: transaldolase [Puniceicoccales bacterium]|jgi:transaldolase|nr:transaldolase [Puniceicoccales bacterium]
MSLLDHLRTFSTVVADTGNLDSIHKFHPRDTTTNPSIVLKSMQEDSRFLHPILTAYPQLPLPQIVDRLLVAIGAEILKIIPGRISTEVDARLSFDVDATVAKARELVALYAEKKIGLERILIKIAATWEGIRAAQILEKEGIHCNMTLIFSLEQAVACGEIGATLISPFVGRILDWYQSHSEEVSPHGLDPGVHSVRRIFNYYKKFGYGTEIMAASFRNVDEILALAGCDLLTISPKFLEELSLMEGNIENRMGEYDEKWERKMELNESNFRFLINENQMATEKLSEGIRFFCRDARQLETLIASQRAEQR